MMTARIIVLIVALGAGAAAAYIVSGTDTSKSVATNDPAPQLATVDVLVAKTDIGLGQAVKPDNLQWQSWPAATASSMLIRRDNRPDAASQVAGSIARAPFITGEPIREQKLVKSGGAGFMAAILPTGMRAVSTDISPETASGGFILPNDRVDVVLTRHVKDPSNAAAQDIVVSQIILSNIRVLAIDQAPKEKDGQNTLVGRTVTLELKPEQTATLAAARQAGTLSLALRSIADADAVDIPDDNAAKRGVSVNVVRYGIPAQTTAQK